MAKRYRPVDRDQPYLFPPSMRDWLPEDHPVWLVIRAVEEHMDTSAFHALRHTGGPGTAGYDPDMLVTVLTWAYAHQVTSSRRIEQLCGTDVAFRVICAGNTPRHVTIAEFRKAFPEAIGQFFAQVLALCARLGMGKLGVVALDGMKIAANASKSANRTEETLARLASLRAGRAAAERAEADKAQAWRERQRDGQPTGRAPAASAVALAGEKVERARAAQQARVDKWEAAAAAGRAPRGPAPAPADDNYIRVRQALAKLQKAQARAVAAAARAAEKEKNRAGPGPVRNITAPDARLMPVRGGGFIEAYNPQNVTSQDGLVIATELTDDTTDTAWFEPMLRAAEDAAAFITARRPAAQDPQAAGDSGSGPAGCEPGDSAAPASLIELFLSDAGYLSEHNLTIPGPDRLIATGKTRDLEKAARDPDASDGDGVPWASPPIAAMAARLATPEGITAYRKRGHIAETPHGQIKHNMGIRRLATRGKPKASAEWRFTCTVHNLFKAITAGHLTTAALDHLASQASYPPAPQAA